MTMLRYTKIVSGYQEIRYVTISNDFHMSISRRTNFNDVSKSVFILQMWSNERLLTSYEFTKSEYADCIATYTVSSRIGWELDTIDMETSVAKFNEDLLAIHELKDTPDGFETAARSFIHQLSKTVFDTRINELYETTQISSMDRDILLKITV
jgi:hypothetical protein